MTDPTSKRPAHVKAPSHWQNPPVPAPVPSDPNVADPDTKPDRLEPTRYGDWEKKGIAIDF